MKLLTSTLLILAAPLSFAEWTLSPDSSVKFLSTKNTNITEVHEFTQVSGSVTDQGNAEIAIDLSSVETGIGIPLQGEDGFFADRAQQAAGGADVSAGGLLAHDEVEETEDDDAAE